MVNITTTRVNSAVSHTGEWLELADEFEGASVHARGFTDAYHDAIAQRMRKAAQRFRGETALVPIALRRVINVECLITHALTGPRDGHQGVKGIENADGSPMTFAHLCEALKDRDYMSLLAAVTVACATAGTVRDDDIKAAAGN